MAALAGGAGRNFGAFGLGHRPRPHAEIFFPLTLFVKAELTNFRHWLQ
jgi:hypothetical protein